MIDLHSHYLPAIDDGARSVEDSIAMLRQAAADGIEAVVVTPHAFIDSYRENTAGRLEDNYQAFVAALAPCAAGGPAGAAPLPRVLLGAENFVNDRFVLALERGEPVLTLNRTSYVLLEFPLFGAFRHFDRLMSALFARDLTPVFAHPERNSQFQQDHGLLASLVGQGVCLQLDSMSLTGGFGSEARALAAHLLKQRLAHLVASDAHDVDRRRPLLSGARAVAARTVGEANADVLFRENPGRIIRGEEVRPLGGGEPAERPRGRSWLASLFGRGDRS